MSGERESVCVCVREREKEGGGGEKRCKKRIHHELITNHAKFRLTP